MMVGVTILNANDLELVGKNVLKNSNDIEMIKKELEVIKQKLNIDANKNLFIEGDKIIKFKKSENDNSSVAKKYKAIVNTVIRFSPSEFSQVIVNVKKGQELTEENFYTESKKINDWIYVGNGFIEKKNLMEIENVKK